MQAFDDLIGLLEWQVEAVRLQPAFPPLCSILKVRRVLALTLIAETGDIRRFSEVENVASYGRCVRSEQRSNGKRKNRGNTQNGNKCFSGLFARLRSFALNILRSGDVTHIVQALYDNALNLKRILNYVGGTQQH